MDVDKTTMQSLWIGKRLSLIEQLSIKSFIAHGHKFRLYTYEEVENIPDGVELCDANEIIAQSKIFYTRKNGTPAIFADWFRWELLTRTSGYWVDLDVVCLRRFDFDEDYVFGLQSQGEANIAVLAFPSRKEVPQWMARICANPNRPLPYDGKRMRRKKWFRRIFLANTKKLGKWGEAGGPPGFSKALQHFDLMRYAKPFTFFYPVHHECWHALFDETFKDNHEFFSGSYAIHLWNEKQRGIIDKDDTFPSGSYVEYLKRRYL